MYVAILDSCPKTHRITDQVGIWRLSYHEDNNGHQLCEQCQGCLEPGSLIASSIRNRKSNVVKIYFLRRPAVPPRTTHRPRRTLVRPLSWILVAQLIICNVVK